MTLLTMPDGTTFASNTLDALAQQWAAWVHGQGWETLSEAQQKAATSECATRLRQLLGVEVSESAAVLARAAVCRGPGCYVVHRLPTWCRTSDQHGCTSRA